MYEVILPQSNRLVNKLFNTKKAANDISMLFMENLLKVLRAAYNNKSIKSSDIRVVIKGKPYVQNGQFIVIHKNNSTKYIFFSYECAKGTRNGYIVSKIPIALRTWYKDDATKKSFDVFILDMTKEDYEKDNYQNVDFCNYTTSTVNSYQTFAYKLCKTLGLHIINYDKLPWDKNTKTKANHAESNVPFSSLSELRTIRDKHQKKNTGNKSSYILEVDDKVIIYGKTFGNNGFETILIAAAVKKITSKHVFFWQIKDTNTMTGTQRKATPITKENKQLLRSFNITVFDELQDYTENENAKVKERDARNQIEFRKNLMMKYGSETPECYLCKCNLPHLIIASHIHRICDINKENNKSFEERRSEAVSKDNGLWLCANHDKLFEYGSIYFTDSGELAIRENITEEQKQFVLQISSKCDANGEFRITHPHLTEEMKSFLKLHRLRTQSHE